MTTAPPSASSAPRTLWVALCLAVAGGLVGTAAGVAALDGEELAPRLVLGLVVLLVVSMLPAVLAWFALRGYLLAWLVLILSSGLTLLREAPALPDLPALALVVLAAAVLVCLLAPVTVTWIRSRDAG